MKCDSCRVCLGRSGKVIVDNKLYLVCKLCKRVWKNKDKYSLEEIQGEEKELVLKQVNLSILD